ncbi:hypothetical protein [Arthrobacter sp. Cr_A7]|uniref:hypothetical protein n=1 Tax=Arthrobacter sp. Cr_A7 TaxID=3031017 RepID=UPI0023D9F67D|nr:hypothetical protein [Arthrobacter sp. Cr_A7]
MVTAKKDMQVLPERAAQPGTNRLWRTVCRWWREIEVRIVTAATSVKAEANSAVMHLTRTNLGTRTIYTTPILLRSATRTPAKNINHEP